MNENVKKRCQQIIDRAYNYFVAEEKEPLEKILISMIAGQHLLFEDQPGLGKTLLVKIFASLIDIPWGRIQFTPDLMPAAVAGTKIWNERSNEFELQRGPVFTTFLLADEINRAMPKTQSALLEAMEELQVTIEGETLELDETFVVMATQNPIENEGTYALPEAQLDRFGMKMSLGYIEDTAVESDILHRRIDWQEDDPTDQIDSLLSYEEFRQLRRAVEQIKVEDSLIEHITRLVQASREQPEVEYGSSPRGSLALLALARARAIIHGRSYVIPDDIRALYLPTLRHRIILTMDSRMDGITSDEVLESIYINMPAPGATET